MNSLNSFSGDVDVAKAGIGFKILVSAKEIQMNKIDKPASLGVALLFVEP